MPRKSKGVGRGNNKNSLAALVPHRFVPGQPSANPSGRPKFKLISDALKSKLEEVGSDGRTRAEIIAENILLRAELERPDAELLLDRTEGRVKQHVDFTGNVDVNAMAKGELVDKLTQLLTAGLEQGNKRTQS